MGIITEIELNDLGDVVSAKIRKCNGEIIRRHISDLILLESSQNYDRTVEQNSEKDLDFQPRPQRAAALESRRKFQEFLK